MENIKELKNICHYYFDRYVESTLEIKDSKKHFNKKRRNAYHRLAQELRTDAFKCHFSKMNTVEELEKALVILKSW